MQFKQTFRKKAFGLIEVLITLAISSILILGAITTASRALRTIRAFEIRDTASGVMLRSLELTRTPVDINLTDYDPGTYVFYVGADEQRNCPGANTAGGSGNNTQNYCLSPLTSGSSSLDADAQISDMVNSCTATSTGADVVQTVGNFPICNRVILEKTAETDIDITYKVTSIVVYEFNNNTVSDSLVSFRTELKNAN